MSEEIQGQFRLLLKKLEEQSTLMVDLKKSIADITARVEQVEVDQNESFSRRLDALANLPTPTGLPRTAAGTQDQPGSQINFAEHNPIIDDATPSGHTNRIIDLTHTLSPHVFFSTR